MKGSDIVDLVIVKLEEKSAFLKPAGEGGPILSGGDNIDELKPVYSYINAHIAEAADEVLVSVPLNKLVPEDALNHTLYSSSSTEWTRTATANADGSGKIILPADFLRLYTLRMNGWDRPIHKAITKTDHLYTLQHNKFTKGTPQKPVVVFSGDRVLLDEFVADLGNNAFDICLYETNSTFSSASTYNAFIKNTQTGLGIESYIYALAILQSGVTKVLKQYGTGGTTENPQLIEVKQMPYLEYYSCIGSTHTIDELLYVPHYRETTDYNRQVAEVIALNCAKKVLEVYGQTEKATAMAAEINAVMQNMQL